MRVLDLFCGAGGAGFGYFQAGFEVIGIDINKQPNYPFEFYRIDFRDGLDKFINEVDIIHASPPCQAYSKATKKWGRSNQHPDLIPELREKLVNSKRPYVIENVRGAPLRNPIELCGTMFDLGVVRNGIKVGELRRHRLFESSFEIKEPRHYKHTLPSVGVYGHSGGRSNRDNINFWTTDDWREAMGIDWMKGKELAESIPPAYTKYIAEEFISLS